MSRLRRRHLPSQAGRPDQAATEGAADAALARAGLRRDDVNPRLAVQVAVSQDAVGYGPAWGPPSWVNVGVGGAAGAAAASGSG
jgi:heme O synthase-like polyprenyltransferase